MSASHEYQKLFYRCANAIKSHGGWLLFDQCPPDRCPACNAPLHHASVAKVAGCVSVSLAPVSVAHRREDA